jgi:hypothetical protein
MKKSLLDLVCSMYFSPFCFGAVRSNGLEIFLSCEWRAPAYSLVVCRPETDFPAARNLFPFVFCVGHCAAFTSLVILSFGLDFLPQEHCAHLGESFFFLSAGEHADPSARFLLPCLVFSPALGSMLSFDFLAAGFSGRWIFLPSGFLSELIFLSQFWSNCACSPIQLLPLVSSLSARQGPVLILLRACPGQLIPGSVHFWWR